MEAKQIETRICEWPRVVNSVATKGDFRRFSPNIFPKYFYKVVFIIISKDTWIFISFWITVKMSTSYFV